MTPETLRTIRETAGLSCPQAAALVGVTVLTWRRWEGQSARLTEIPFAAHEFFLLRIGAHPTLALTLK